MGWWMDGRIDGWKNGRMKGYINEWVDD